MHRSIVSSEPLTEYIYILLSPSLQFPGRPDYLAPCTIKRRQVSKSSIEHMRRVPYKGDHLRYINRSRRSRRRRRSRRHTTNINKDKNKDKNKAKSMGATLDTHAAKAPPPATAARRLQLQQLQIPPQRAPWYTSSRPERCRRTPSIRQPRCTSQDV